MTEMHEQPRSHYLFGVSALACVGLITYFLVNNINNSGHFQFFASSQGAIAHKNVTENKITDFSQQITSTVTSLNLIPYRPVFIPLTIKNTGKQIWMGLEPRTVPKEYNQIHVVTVAYHWLNLTTHKSEEGGRTYFYQNVMPGQTIQLQARMVAPGLPGKYQLKVSLLQEGIAWFDRSGGQGLVIPANIINA